MTFRTLILVVLCVTGLGAAEAAKRPIAHGDLWLLKRVGTPALSPDGKWAVFLVTAPAYDAKDQTADLWLTAVDGASPPRKLTHTKASESGVKWSPDAKRIAFSSKREGDDAAQIYVLDLVGGGEAERITSLSTGASAPEWSPDGTRLLFISDVYPGADDDEANRQAAKRVKERKHHARVYEGFPIKYWDRWLDEKRTHLFVQEAKAGAVARDLFAGTKFAALPGFGAKETNSGREIPVAWAPDGRTVVFAAVTTRNRAAYEDVPTQLFETAVDGGEPRPLTNDPHNYTDPKFSEDGTTLLARVEAGGDAKTYHHHRLAAFPWPFDATKRRLLAAELDLSVVGYDVGGGGQVFFTAEAGDRTTLFAVPASGGAVRAIDAGPEGCIAGVAASGGTVVATFDSATQPAEIVTIDAGRGGARRLTRFNDEKIAALDLPRPERFAFTTAKGRTIHNLLIKPAGFDPAKKYPVFAVIHGGPAPQFKDQWVLRWNYHLLASTDFVLVLTNYTGSSGYSEAFGQAIQHDPLKGPADEINQAVDEAIARFSFLDGTRLAAGGASYGGHLANWLQATTTRYKCLISHAGLVNLETQWATSDGIFHRELNNGGPIWEQGAVWREQNPVRLVPNHLTKTGWVTPMLVTVGEKDYRVPANNAYENWGYLQRLQVPSKLIVFPEENHWVLNGENSRFWYGEVHAWLARWLGESASGGTPARAE